MNNIVFTHQLQFDCDKFEITKRLYHELMAKTNEIGDYSKCRNYVRLTMSNCMKEVKQVSTFVAKKIDITL